MKKKAIKLICVVLTMLTMFSVLASCRKSSTVIPDDVDTDETTSEEGAAISEMQEQQKNFDAGVYTADYYENEWLNISYTPLSGMAADVELDIRYNNKRLEEGLDNIILMDYYGSSEEITDHVKMTYTKLIEPESADARLEKYKLDLEESLAKWDITNYNYEYSSYTLGGANYQTLSYYTDSTTGYTSKSLVLIRVIDGYEICIQIIDGFYSIDKLLGQFLTLDESGPSNDISGTGDDAESYNTEKENGTNSTDGSPAASPSASENTPSENKNNGSSGSEHKHSFTEHKGKAATCTEKGYADYKTCSCGYSTYRSISALGHSHSLAESREPTCNTEGYSIYKCIRCSDSYKNSIAATGHNYTDATCTTPKTCTVCNHTEGSPLSHNMEYTKCTRCDYSDFSYVAKTYSKFCYDSWYYLGNQYTSTDGRYLEEGEASMSISNDGICNVTFAEYSYTFTLVQSKCDGYGIHFDCYLNGEYLANTEVWYFFDQNRCELSIRSGTLGFSQVCLSFAKT